MSSQHSIPTAVPSTPVTVTVTVIGLGAMGRALAGALVKAGHPTTVWNRSPGKADELVARGAVLAATAREAVLAGELIIVCVVDYDAAQAILDPLGDALKGRVLVNLTSDLPARSRAAANWAQERSIAYLDGAVMVPTSLVGTPDALLFYAGSRESFDRHEPVLKSLGGKAEFVGADAGLAAVYDLSLLDYFYGSITGLVHAFALAKAEGVRAVDIAPHLDTITRILPAMASGSAATGIDARSYPGEEANLAMMAVSVDHILHAARARGLDTSHLEAIKSVADRAVARGHGADDWTSTIEAVLNP
ncbi:NAD(P)-binding domain-containing protein [Streptomyces sp. NPDC005963]|uniref:NAD(P)-dependent oxidoreductase n=1 Tax=Streptomyces sp. NPDC005963 TaxID=3156721 RepID=UPI0033EA6D5B